MVYKRAISGLKPKQLKAINTLVGGGTQLAAAKAAGVNKNTIGRWLRNDAAFIARYHSELRELKRIARDRLISMVGDAIDSLKAVASNADPDSTPSRVRAAGLILRFAGLDQAEPIGSDNKYTVEAKLTREETARVVDMTITVLSQNVKMMASRLLMDPDASDRQIRAAAEIIADSAAADSMAELKPLKTEIDATEDDLMKARAFEPGLKEIIPQDRQEAWDEARKPKIKSFERKGTGGREGKRLQRILDGGHVSPPWTFKEEPQPTPWQSEPPLTEVRPIVQPEPEAPDAGDDEPEGPEDWEWDVEN